MVRPTGIEPVHLAPEASALSPELRAHVSKNYFTISAAILQAFFKNNYIQIILVNFWGLYVV
jgi:hypothetical protein